MMKKPRISTFLKFYRPALFSSALVLGITFYLFFETYKQFQEKNNALFDLRAVAVTDAIKSRMMDYIQILKGAQSLLNVSDSVSRQAWKGYAEGVNVKEHYPGVQGIGFSVFVADSNKTAFEARVREEGFPDFAIWPSNPREMYSAILYLEPFDSINKRAFGYDMYTDSARHKAMNIALETGKPTITSGVILVQEIVDEVQKGLNLYLPIYKKGADTSTVENRRKNIVGFAYSPFRIYDLMKGTLGNEFDDLDIQIYDEGRKGEGGLLYWSSNDNKVNGEGLINSYKKMISIEVAEHVWDIHITANTGFGYDREVPFYLLGGGMVISLLVFLIVISFGYIRRSTYLKQVIADNAVAAIFIVNQDGFCTFTNPAAERLTGYSFDEIKLEQLWALLFRHNDMEQSAFSMERETSMQDALIYHKSGTPIYVNLNTKPIYEYSNRVSLLVQATDMTQEKEAESSLMQKNKMLQALNQVGINLSVELDLKKLLQQIVDICTEITDSEFGVFFYQVDDHNETFVMHATSIKNYYYIESVIDSWPQYTILDVLRIDDASESKEVLMPEGMAIGKHPVRSFLAVPVKSRNGVVIGTLYFGHTKAGMFQEHEVEITKGIAAQAAIALDNSQLFEAISNKNEELIKINNDLDNFVYTASHDLKAPVLNIEGLVYVLTKALEEGKIDKAEKMIEMIKISILKFKETIQALTEVAKTNKNIDDEVVKVDLKELFEDIKLSIEDMVEAADADIAADFTKLGTEDIYFSLANMRSLLINLMTNAIKYRSPERKPIIRLSFEKEDKQLIIKVSDNGLGIAKEHQERIFQMFKRMHTQVEGTGIGLYLVKRIVENQGGSIAIDSEVNKGTTFTLYLPLK